MKKKILAGLLSAAAVLALSACGGGGGGGTVIVDPGPEPVTLFLLDESGFSYGGVPYSCDGVYRYTAPNGEFTFYEYESCTFDFDGYDGNYANDPSNDDIIRITDDLGIGVEGIAYDCWSYGPGSTRIDGDFAYDVDDECTFHFEGIY